MSKGFFALIAWPAALFCVAVASPCHAQGGGLTIPAGSDFVAGDVILLREDFQNVRLGSFPATWATDASGRVVTLDGVAGRWLELQPDATYKLGHTASLPAKFMLEFDALAMTDEVKDLATFTFGFSRSRSVAGGADAINEIALYYMNGEGGLVGSDIAGINGNFAFDLAGYARRPLHVSITVDADES